MSKEKEIKIGKAKGRPMLTWVGKRPLTSVRAYPAQHVESFAVNEKVPLVDCDWSDWPDKFDKGGMLFHGDNKDVLAYLLANGFRGKVKLIYIDPPFDSGADYIRKVQLRGVSGTQKIDGEEYTLGEQIQYTDIWANDSYLQFIYERFLLLKELLSNSGSLFIHCDYNKSHHIRTVAEEIFGQDNFVNEITWRRKQATSYARKQFGITTDTIFWFSKTDIYNFNPIYSRDDENTEKYLKERFIFDDGDGRKYMKSPLVNSLNRPNLRYVFHGVKPPDNGWLYKEERMEELFKNGELVMPENNEGRIYRKIYEDTYQGQLIQNIWLDIPIVNPMALERVDFPTQKPEALVDRIINTASLKGDIVLDCFLGSGTTVVSAQKNQRRWIGCDINKGAIQTTAKRLQTIINEQTEILTNDTQQSLVEDENAPVKPCQLSFTTWRVNDYDLQIQHNEAVELACEYIGITRTRSDGFFDGSRGKRLVKIIPFNHPLTPLDLEAIRNELEKRPEEERDIEIVCLGMELTAQAWLENYNRNRPVNKFHLIELRTDNKYGGFIKHEPLTASVKVKRKGDKLFVEVNDVYSPSIVKRLNMEQGLFKAQIDDWRAVVDCIMIDTNYNGQVFNVTLSDVPAKKSDLVNGQYELPAPPKGSTVAVKIIDMLGEEYIYTKELD